MPGITSTLNAVRDPILAAAEAVSRRSPEKNQAINPGFDEERPAGKNEKDLVVMDWQSGAVPGFAQWQSDDSKGTFSWDKNSKSGKMQAVTNGCFIQKYRVRSGEKFLVEVESNGEGDRVLIARWQTPDGKWTSWDQDRSFGFKVQSDKHELARGIVTVPEKAGQLVLLLMATHQKANESCLFNKLGVYRLQDLLKPK